MEEVFIKLNKKVLLRERKRHTARRVVSTPSVVLPGYPPSRVPPPILTWLGGVPDQVPPQPGYTPPPPGGVPGQVPPQGGYPVRTPPDQGTPPARVPPHPDLARGGTWLGTPPGQGTSPRLDLAVYPPTAPWHSGKCCKALWDMGTPPPGVDRQTKWNYYLPVVLRTRAVKIS